jgi:hypothetical protein
MTRAFSPAHWTRHHWLVLALLAFGILSVVSTYTRLSETDDELFHVSCGMEWWETGVYKRQPLHPPLGRVMGASLVYLDKLLNETPPEKLAATNPAEPAAKPKPKLSPREYYMKRMVLSRLGELPYYILSCVLVYLWSRRIFGAEAGLWSLGSYVTISSVAAHGAVATTDIGYMAMLIWALMAGFDWLRQPSIRNSLLLGLSLGLMIGTKFSGLAHWPVCMALITGMMLADNHRRGKPLSPIVPAHIVHGFLIILPLFTLVLFLIYRFDFSPLHNGIKAAMRLDSKGFGVWFYGPLNHKGTWMFFPVVFFFKTSLTLMFTAALGSVLALAALRTAQGRIEQLFPVVCALAVLGMSMTSNINLGVRHVLPMYPLLAIPAGYGLFWLWQGGIARRIFVVLLVLAQVIGFATAHPEHIAYFNVLAGKEPERITLDSDYDWGQAMILLDEALQRRSIKAGYLCVRKDAVWSAQYVVSIKMQACPKAPITGWIAVGRAFRLLNPDNFAWLNEYQPVERIGKTMDLYYIAPK